MDTGFNRFLSPDAECPKPNRGNRSRPGTGCVGPHLATGPCQIDPDLTRIVEAWPTLPEHDPPPMGADPDTLRPVPRDPADGGPGPEVIPARPSTHPGGPAPGPGGMGRDAASPADQAARLPGLRALALARASDPEAPRGDRALYLGALDAIIRDRRAAFWIDVHDASDARIVEAAVAGLRPRMGP